jgi:hypothetical protein
MQNCFKMYILDFGIIQNTISKTILILGLSWRWALSAVADGSGVELQLQALPSNLASISAIQAYGKDNIAAVTLAAFPVLCGLFDGDIGAGPVPTLFSTDPEGTVERMRSNPRAAHQICQALATRLLTLEQLSGTEALELVLNPREGKAASPFTRVYREVIPPPQVC